MNQIQKQDNQEVMFSIKEMLQKGISLHKKKNFSAAAQAYKSILSIEPNNADALQLLGAITAEQGQNEEAIKLINQALKIHPQMPGALNNLALAYQREGQWDKAAQKYEELLLLQPDHFEGNLNLGIVREAQKQFDEALRLFNLALEIRPDHIGTLLRKGGTLQNLEREEEALHIYLRILELNPENAQAHHDLAVIHLKKEEDSQAEHFFRKAIEINPRYAEAFNHLGVCLLQQGKFEEAARYLEQAINVNKNYVKAYYHLLNTKSLTKNDPMFESLERLKAKDLSLEERSFLYFILGKILDRSEDFDQAFLHYQIGNRCHLELSRKSFDSKEHARQAIGLAKNFSPDSLSQIQTSNLDDETPIFIVGMPRTGTTLTEQILSSHPDVHGAGELKTLGNILSKNFYSKNKTPLRDLLKSLTQEQLREMANEYLHTLRDIAPQAHYVTDKMPFNYQNLGFIYILFPRAKIIHCRRNPLDTCLSCFFQKFNTGNLFSFDLSDLGLYYRYYEWIMAKWHQMLPLAILDLDYEALVNSPEVQIARLLDFCGLSWDERCVNFHKNQRTVRTASLDQVRQKMYTTSTFKWQKYAAHITPLQTALSDPRCLETGQIYQNLGLLAQAEEIYHRVLRNYPKNPHAWHLLGVVYHHQGKNGLAAENIRQAIALDKQQALFYSNLGLVLKELKQYEEAKRAHQQSVDLNPASAINRRYLANILKTIGKLDQAEEQIYKAYELDKTDTNSLILMAQIAQAKKRPLEALNTVSQAITLAPNSLPAQNLLGLILMENGQTEKALKIFDQIVNISPLEAGFRLNRGNALRDLHRLKEAALAFRQCLKLNIHMTGAFYGLSQVEAIRPADELVQKMQKMLRQEGLGHTLKESILYALGIALENEEKYSQALECWDQANKLRQSRTRFDIRQEKAKWNRIQRFFPTAQHHERTVKLQPEAQTLFVVGMPCTGKRLIETILASNQDIARLGDSELIHSLAVNTPKHHGLKKSFPFYLSEIDQETLLSIGNEYVQGAKYITKENFHCFVNRQFHNAYYIGFIRKILPNAKVIYCYRNLKDVCFSSYTQKFQNTFSFPCKLRDIITMYHLYEQTIRFWKNIFPDMILEVSFEQIITHPTSVIKELLEYCELPVNWRVTHQKLIAVQKQISKDQGFFCLGPHAPIGRWERFSSLLSPESFQNPN